CTAYREAMDYINMHAPQGSVVSIWGPVPSARRYARDDLVVEEEGTGRLTVDFALGCKWMLDNPAFFTGFEDIYQVSRAGASLAEVKARPGLVDQ
ncbi:MAG: hypothetical protein WBR18_09485, partial [Anaerolineales bacterium]